MKRTNKETIKQVKKLDDTFAETEKDVVEEIGKSFAKNSSSENSKKIQNLKHETEKYEINFNSMASENYNDPFTRRN